jgi:Tol biopolymer transport system component
MRTTHPVVVLLVAAAALVGLPATGHSETPSLQGQIAFSQTHNGTRQIYTVDPAVGSVEAVTNDSMQDLDPAWSPDGSELLFAGKSGRFAVETHLYLLDPNGVRHQLTAARSVDRTPAWSPDGVRIAFSRGSGTGGDSRIWLMHSDGTRQRPLTTGGAGISQGSPAWSPGGSAIAYTGTQDGLPQIFELLLNRDGTVAGRRRLTDDSFSDGNPAWSPDGSRLAFERCCLAGHSVIETLDLATGATHAVTTSQIEASHPTWSPDGTAISFVGYALTGGPPAIYTVGADGSGLRELTSDADPDFTPAWQPSTAVVPRESAPIHSTGLAETRRQVDTIVPTVTERHRHRRRYQTLSSHLIAPGVRFRRIVDHAGPNRIDVVGVEASSRVSVGVALANGLLGGFQRTSSMARGHHAIAAVNGDFGIGTGRYHQPGALGRPMHLFAKGGNLVQSMFGLVWNFGLGARLGAGDVFSPPTAVGGARLGAPRPKVFLRDDSSGLTWPIQRFNEGLPLGSGRPGWGEIEAYTSAATAITPTPRTTCWARLLPQGPPSWAGSGEGVQRAYDVDVSACSRARIAPENGVVVAALPTDQQSAAVRSLQPGDPVTLRWTLGWGRTLDADGGFPILVHAGHVVAPNCRSSFCTRNPRTAIGITSHGRVLLVTVDGRSPSSVGMSLAEEGALLQHLGAVEALNVDGGGSTTMVVHGNVVNRPSDGHERGVTSSILVLSRRVPAGPRAPGRLPASRMGSAASWPLAERDPGSTGGLWDALVRGAFGLPAALPPEVRAIVRAYRSG